MVPRGRLGTSPRGRRTTLPGRIIRFDVIKKSTWFGIKAKNLRHLFCLFFVHRILAQAVILRLKTSYYFYFRDEMGGNGTRARHSLGSPVISHHPVAHLTAPLDVATGWWPYLPPIPGIEIAKVTTTRGIVHLHRVVEIVAFYDLTIFILPTAAIAAASTWCFRSRLICARKPGKVSPPGNGRLMRRRRRTITRR